MTWLYITIFIVSALVLVRSGTWVVKSLTRIARFLEWREFIVASLLMAFATSIPELFVGITSAFHGQPDLSFGNVIGSNIINLTLLVGIGVLMAGGLKTSSVTFHRTSIYTSALATLPIILMLDGRVSRVDGFILLLALAVYLHQILLEEEKFTKVFNNKFKKEKNRWPKIKPFFQDLLKFFGGLFLLLLSAEGIVQSSSFFGAAIGLPMVVIGAIIVALGTNLPEVVFGVKAITLGHKDMVLGNLMGSVTANSTLVLGITFIISPMNVPNFSIYAVGIVFTIFSALLFAVFSRTNEEISKKEAIALLGIYIFFVIIQLTIS